MECYDCTKKKDEDEMYEATEGTIVKVIRKVCFRCYREREKANKNQGNWKSGKRSWIQG